jgi:hypothetical protein
MADSLRRINHRHNAVINWLLSHPDRTLRDCAEFFGYSPEWVRRLVRTDVFQRVYRERAEAAGVAAVHCVRDKIVGLADAVLDESLRRVEAGQASDRFLGDALRTTLASLGYVTPSPSQTTNIQINVDPQRIVEARERALALKAGSTDAKAANNG